MARAASPFKSDLDTLRGEIKQLQQELLGVNKEITNHERAVAEIQMRREYLQDLIQVKQRTVSRYARLGKVRVPPGRRPGRPRKAERVMPATRRRRVARRARPVPAVAGNLANLSVTDATQQILKSAGKPVHLKELVAAMISRGKKIRAKKPEVSVRNAIAKDKRFRNAGRNNWTLA